jgi:hypothetical protein
LTFPSFYLLCCPVLSPQMTGVEEADPPTTKVSEHVPTVGWAVVKEMKSKLKIKKMVICYLGVGVATMSFEIFTGLGKWASLFVPPIWCPSGQSVRKWKANSRP